MKSIARIVRVAVLGFAAALGLHTAFAQAIDEGDDRVGRRVEEPTTRLSLRAGPPPRGTQRVAARADTSASEEAGRKNAVYVTDRRPGSFAPPLLGRRAPHALAPRRGSDFLAPPASGRTGPGGVVPGGLYQYFDGLETYAVDRDPNDDRVDPDFGWSREANPNLFSPAWDIGLFTPVATIGGDDDLGDAVFPDRQALLSGANAGAFLPASVNPYDPGNVGGYPSDCAPGVEQSMSSQRGTLQSLIGDASFLAYAGETNFDLLVAGAGSTPTGGDACIVLLDFYLPTLDTLVGFETVSTVEDGVGARVLMGGFNPLPDWALFRDADGRADHFGVLGTEPGNLEHGRWFFTPENGIAGVDTLTVPTNEWFTVAVRMSGADLQIWARTSRTDGTISTITDPGKVALFESGWAQVYPGRPGNAIGGDTFEGVGVAVDRFFRQAEQPLAPLLNAASVNNVTFYTGLDPVAPAPVVPGWAPTNAYWDNLAVLGQPFDVRSSPKFRLPYRDDMELYQEGALLRAQTRGRWSAGLQTSATIRGGVDATNASPAEPATDCGDQSNQSIEQWIQFNDSIFREEIGTDLPAGLVRENERLVFRASVQLNDATNGWLFRLEDNTNADAFLGFQFGASNVNDDNDGRVYVRLPNPQFDLGADPDPASGDDLPEENYGIGFNVPSISLPTIATVNGSGILGGFITIECVIDKAGYAFWTIDGAPLLFDRGRIQALDVLHAGPGRGLEGFLDESNAIKNAAGGVEPDDTVFALDWLTIDRFECWSSNNPLAVGNTLFVDDVEVDAASPADFERPGPLFSLQNEGASGSYFDDFEDYVAHRTLSEQGDTDIYRPRSLVDGRIDVTRGLIELAEQISPPPLADYCLYEVAELLAFDDREGAPIPDDFGFATGDLIFVEQPGPGFVCPAFAVEAGRRNARFMEDSGAPGGLSDMGLRIELVGVVNGDDAAGADFVAQFDRYRPGRLFCRYDVVGALQAQANWFKSGLDGDDFNPPPLYDVPNWQPGDVVAVDALPISGRAVAQDPGDPLPCPGMLVAKGPGGVRYFLDEEDVDQPDCVAGIGAWNIIDQGVVKGDVRGVAAGRQAGDLLGFEIVAPTLDRWRGGDTIGQNAWVVSGIEENDALGVTVDPGGLFGQIVRFVNTGRIFQPDPGEEFDDLFGDLPIASASEQSLAEGGSIAEAFLDLYVQDLNSPFIIELSGTGERNAHDEVPVLRIRLGGPGRRPFDALPPGFENQILVSENAAAGDPEDYRVCDIPTVVPVQQWFSLAVRLVEDGGEGRWSLGVRTVGLPTGPDPTLSDYTIIAEGDAFTDANGSGLPIKRIDKIQFRQNYAPMGAGFQFYDPTRFVPRAFDAAPGGDPLDNFCFYEIETIEAEVGQLLPGILDVNEFTGFGDNPGSVRALRQGDIVALPFANVGQFYDLCPNNATVDRLEFEVLDGGVVTGRGTWRLLGGRDQAGLNFPPPATGISNPFGPSLPGPLAEAYNFDATVSGDLARDILIADFEGFDDIPDVAPRSRWYLGDLLLRQVAVGPCPDLANDDATVTAADLSVLLASWGPVAPSNPADLVNDDDIVNAADLSALLAAWGRCLPR